MKVRAVLIWFGTEVGAKIIWVIRVNLWWVLLVVSAVPALDGYTGTASMLWLKLFPAVGFWWWGFDRARRGERQALDRLRRLETQRWALFGCAVVGAAMMVAGAHHMQLARRGEEVLYLAAGFTIKRQGYRIGGKHLARWEYLDELKYGALGNIAVMMLIAAVVLGTGEVVNAIELAMFVTPIGLIALSDEPLYGNEEMHAMRGLIRLHRRTQRGILDRAW